MRRARNSALFVCLISFFIASIALARPIRFAPAQTFPSGITHTTRVAIGDFNGDGYPDLAVSSTYNNIAVFLAKGNGTFSDPMIYPLSYYVTGQVAIGDFNGDGKIDMAVVGGDIAGHGLAFFAGNGDGTFQPARYFTTILAGGSISAVAADFNHDNNLDIFAGGNCGGEILIGDGKGNFHDGQVIAACGDAVAVGDFNRDGNLDVASTESLFFPAGVAIMLGNGDGTFQEPQRYSGMEEPVGIVAGDFNHDGKFDLATPDYKAAAVFVLQGNGDGTFTQIGQWYAGADPGAIATGDFNVDGKLDLAVTDFSGNGLAVFPGKGNGTFPSFLSVPTAARPTDVAAVDLNHDGSIDLVVVNNGAESVSVLLNAEGTYVQLTSSLNPSKVGQPVTFTASVQGSVIQSPAPSGNVTFKDGSKTLGRVSLGQGKASFTTSALRKGNHNITVAYSGDGNFNPNRSGVLIQKVQ